jgi:hypothetical protein
MRMAANKSLAKRLTELETDAGKAVEPAIKSAASVVTHKLPNGIRGQNA